MLKFFRKYNKIILVVGGSILMVLFLLPAGMSRMLGAGAGATVATLDGRKVSINEMNQAGRDLQLIGRFTPAMLEILGLDDRHSEHWFLLTQCAARAGLVGGPGDGVEFITRMAETTYQWRLLQASQYDPQIAAQYRAQRDAIIQNLITSTENAREQFIAGGSSPESLDHALAHAYGVFRLLELNTTADVYSTTDAIELAKRVFDSATISYAAIPAGTVAIELEPTTEELQAHFDEYKAVDRAKDPTGVGYLMPDLADVEWITIDREAVEVRLTLDPIEVNRYWRQNRDRFPGEYSANQADIEKAYRRVRSDSIFAKANDLIRRRLHASTASLPTQDKYKALPADWETTRPPLDALAREVSAALVQEFALTPGAEIITVGGPMKRVSGENLQLISGIGQSKLTVTNSSSVTFAQYAMNVRELSGDNRLAAQVGLVYGPLVNDAGNNYYFRVLGVRKAGPPDSLNDVLTMAKTDYRILRGMEMLEESAQDYRKEALAIGLASFARGKGVEYLTDVQVTRQIVRNALTMGIYSRLNVPDFRDPVMDAAQRIDPTVPIADIPLENRIVAVPVPSAKSLLLVEITRFVPMTIERFRTGAAQVRSLADSTRLTGNPFDAFSLDALTKRLKFVRYGTKEPDVAEGNDSTKPESPSGS